MLERVRPLLAVCALLLTCGPTSALAQDLPDASLPDASVGQGGANRDVEENDERGTCVDSKDCERGFVCEKGWCVPGNIRKAGCGGTGALATALVAVGLVLRRRRRGGPSVKGPARR
jgi:hypothetical protein